MTLRRNIVTWSKRLLVVAMVVLWIVLATSASTTQETLGTREDVGIHIDGRAGLSFVTKQQVFRLIAEEYGRPFQGEALEDLDLDSIERIVSTIPQVKHVDAYVDMDRHLGIEIIQKRPLARVLHNDGVSYYLDEEGEMLPLSDNFTARIPVVTGSLIPLREGQTVSDHPSWKALFNLMRTIQHDRFSNALLEEIHIESTGEVLFVPKLGDLVIRFGKVENEESKLIKLRNFYERSIRDINLNKFESIDLRFNGQVVCKKRSS